MKISASINLIRLKRIQNNVSAHKKPLGTNLRLCICTRSLNKNSLDSNCQYNL